MRLRREVCTQRTAFTHREALTHSRLLHREAFTHREAFAHREAFTNSKLLHRKVFPQRSCFTQSSFYTEKPLETGAFTHGRFCTEKLLHTEALTHRTFTYEFAQNISQYYFVLQSLHKVLPSNTLYYKACTKSTSQYYFVLQRLHKVRPSTNYFVLQSLHTVLPSTTWYYKACAKQHFPVLVCTTRYAQSMSQHYTLNYKACTECFPVLLGTTKLAQSTSQSYFVLQGLHKALPSTTLYYKTCMSLRTWQQNVTTIMQPLHWDLQPESQPAHRTTQENRFDLETTPAAAAAHRRYLSSGCSHLHGKTQGFLLRLPPQNKPHATVMQLLPCVLQHDVAPSLYAHDDKTWQ